MDIIRFFVGLFLCGCLFLFFLFCFLEATPPAAEEVTHTQQEDEEKGDKEKGEMEDDTQQDKQVCEITLIK